MASFLLQLYLYSCVSTAFSPTQQFMCMFCFKVGDVNFRSAGRAKVTSWWPFVNVTLGYGFDSLRPGLWVGVADVQIGVDPLRVSASCPQGIIYSAGALTLLFFINRPRRPCPPYFFRYTGAIDTVEPSFSAVPLRAWNLEDIPHLLDYPWDHGCE